MLKYRGANLIRAGFIGATLIILVILIGLQPEKLVNWATTVKYQALFSEGGGVTLGNDVTVSGTKVGTVSDVALQDGDALVTFTVKGAVPLGSTTTAHIRTGTLLGERVLTLESSGSGTMRPLSVIPTSRTSSPYSLTDAVSELTANTAGTDTAVLNQSLDTLSTTLDQIAPQLGPTFDGVARLSKSLNSRNESLGSLLKNAAEVSAVLGKRSDKLNTLILNGNDLLGVLNDRRLAIATLLSSTSSLAQQLSGLVHDNEAVLAPTLERVNNVLTMLERQKENLGKALPGFVKFQLTQGETVSSGFYYNAYVPDLQQGMLLQPFFDYAFGFRRGVDVGSPPDNAGPRAELPLPYNGIPQPNQRWGYPP